jgi:ADP-dependent NAD(P)H-hydrate dehydratase
MSHPDGSSTPLPRLAPRQPDSHKGDFGRALLIGGSQGMAGAIALAGMAALRSGAGLVKLATPSLCQPTVAGFEPSAMTLALPCDRDGRIAAAALPILGEAAAQATAVACGPGLGRGDALVEVVGWLYRNLTQPMVVDADGLDALAQRPDVLVEAPGPRILTPHAGEFARLIGREKILPEERERLARELARRSRAVVVLKGHRTVVTDGQQLSLNPTGNPGMATGGTGDVLTGIITALLCQRLSPYDAARLGVYVHGLSGDLAADDLGQVSLIASDLVAYLPKAWQKVS